ncbi:putative F-box/LRR-repeat protein At3g18150 [Eutrema salsugineum]|uniref:putative F-box/LRR-repeat protein At3g18150 n=1 Tax=Eutrema salsugineum TaxID=72664 RepID=UPI000CED0D8C|nr:putative F-box/LRR-repeat protein At3g18150 [Eutrema salsugineum]
MIRRNRKDGHRKIKRAVEEEDSISSLPDVILQHILCFIPTKFAIRTSLLSKRWRHVWCDIPRISLDADICPGRCQPLGRPKTTADSINETLTRYTAPKTKDFYLKSTMKKNIPHINTWIKGAMSRNVENLSLNFFKFKTSKYTFPDSFYTDSFLKELKVSIFYTDMIPRGSVSWTSLKKFSLSYCRLSDESLATILSGCPVLQSLTLYFCNELRVLDLSNSSSLRTLRVDRNYSAPTPMQIVAPHIHCLKLMNSQLPCTLVDVSSLAEAKLDFWYGSLHGTEADSVRKMQELLEKLHNVEKLTLGENFLQILSLPKLRGLPFPVFNVQALKLETFLFEYVIPPGIERLLQNSHYLKRLTLHARTCKNEVGFRWSNSRRDAESKHVATFIELMFKSIKTLEKMVVRLKDCYLEARGFKEMVQTLPHNNNDNVSIVFSDTRYK